MKSAQDDSSSVVRGDEEAHRDQAVAQGTGELIMVVDDDPVNLEVLRARLELSGYRALCMQSPIEALEHLREADPVPEMILLDVMMPRMSGYDFCREIKQLPRTRDVPVIMVTAKTDVRDKIHALNLGAVDYVTKPFDKRELLAKIRVFLELNTFRRDVRRRSFKRVTSSVTLTDEQTAPGTKPFERRDSGAPAGDAPVSTCPRCGYVLNDE